jgi:hypothetical protein
MPEQDGLGNHAPESARLDQAGNRNDQMQQKDQKIKRAPNLRSADRIMASLCMLFIRRARLVRCALVLKPSTLLHLHYVLIARKYRRLFSPRHGRRPGPKGPTGELINAVLEMKRRNPGWGCPRIADQIALAFGVEIDKDVVRRILTKHYRPESGRRSFEVGRP